MPSTYKTNNSVARRFARRMSQVPDSNQKQTLTVQYLGDLKLVTMFSYETPIAQWDDGKLYVRRNYHTWTTKTHINLVLKHADVVHFVDDNRAAFFFNYNARAGEHSRTKTKAKATAQANV